MRQLRWVSLACALAAAACGSDTTTTPTTPTPVILTDTFTGTLNQNGGQTYTFLTAASGNITATLTTVAPDSTLVVGLSLGTYNGSACQIVLAKDNAIQGASVVGSGNSTGTFCVRIYDVGKITDPITYQIDVMHP
jgi:hypothetical protein